MTEMFDFVFFFKQKTAYEFLTCDWSSGVCSSDLVQFHSSHINLNSGKLSVIDYKESANTHLIKQFRRKARSKTFYSKDKISMVSDELLLPYLVISS